MKFLLFANTEWYLFNFRRSLALALVDAGHEVLLVSPPGPYGERLRALGLRWLPAPMKRRSLNPLRALVMVWWLRELMVRERVDLVHNYTMICVIFGSVAARWAGVSARVNAVTGLGYVFTSQDTKARLLRPWVRLALGLALGGGIRKRGAAGRDTGHGSLMPGSGPREGGMRLILQNLDDVFLFLRGGLVDPEQVRLIPGSGVDCQRFAPESQAMAGTARSPAPVAGAPHPSPA